MSSKSARPANGRGVFYSRDSTGNHEMTPAPYVEWARTRAKELKVAFRGTGAAIDSMIKSNKPFSGDLFFDNAVSGGTLDRPALNALIIEIERDRTISHVFIPRRDRLARPDRATDGVALENKLRSAGVWVVFKDKILPPLGRGTRENFGEAVQAMAEYDASGRFRDEHAEKMLWAKRALAERGYSTGGRAPYGFRRWLIGPNAEEIRPLADGEIVRMAGHHVEWRPGPGEEIAVILRIATMLETLPACRVAKILTQEGVPSPDAGRHRHENGIPHIVRGVWHQTTIINIARNPLLRAVVSFGRRAMGERRRLTKDGFRPVDDDDFDGQMKAKVTRNPPELHITAKASFTPLIDPDRADALDAILNRRAGTQKGKPRSRDPEQNPLGARIYDMACSWPMYRAKVGESFFYRCGLYQQSDAHRCHHNRVDGPAAARVGLEIIRQHLRDESVLAALKARVEARLSELKGTDHKEGERLRSDAALRAAVKKLETIERNMAEADTPAQLAAMKKAFETALKDVEQLREDAAAAAKLAARNSSVETSADDVLKFIDQLPSFADEAPMRGAVRNLFDAVDLRMYLQFDPVKKTKRVVNQLVGGVVTLGSATAPISPYPGPTSRRAMKKASEAFSEALPSGEGDQSSRNVSRGDRI